MKKLIVLSLAFLTVALGSVSLKAVADTNAKANACCTVNAACCPASACCE